MFSKKHVFCILGARWRKIIEFVPSFPIYGWLAWWCDFFSCGANLWRSSACIQPKKVQPLGIYFWHLRLGLFKSPFLVGEAEHVWLKTFSRTHVFSTKKHVFWILGARWHKIIEFVPSCPIYGWLAWWCDFFPVGTTFEDHPHVFSQKRSSPLEFIFDTCASASSSHLFGWWSWTYVVVNFFKDKCMFSKKPVFCILGARWHKIIEFVPSFPIYGWLAWWCDFFPVGPTFEDHPHVFSQKRSSPLEFIFDTCASASSSHLFWLVKLNICGCSLLLGQMYFQQKTFVLHFGRAFRTNVPLCKDKYIFGICSWCLTYAHSAL